MTLFLLYGSLSGQAATGNLAKVRRVYSARPSHTHVLANELYKSKLFYSSAAMMREHLDRRRPLNKKLESLLLKIVFKTGILPFEGLSQKTLLHYSKSPTLNFVLGLRLFKGKKYRSTAKVLKKIPSSHALGPESLLTLGSTYTMLKQYGKAFKSYELCRKQSQRRFGRSRGQRLQIYFSALGENCTAHQARLFYQQQKYERALNLYNQVPKTSFLWPYLLLERAWANYKMEDYNRALGLLVTYKSPLLSNYFLPEADVLQALSYFKLCLWQESSKIIQDYYQLQQERSKHLKKILQRYKKSSSYFLKLVLLPAEEQKKLHPFVYNLTSQVKKKVKYIMGHDSFVRVRKELEYIAGTTPSALTKKLERHLNNMYQLYSEDLNHYVKKQMFTFLNQMYLFSFEMSNIKLKSISYERANLYLSQEIGPKRIQGSLDNVNRTSRQHFYSFDGEFWADELGDYSFGLKSNCQKNQEEDL